MLYIDSADPNEIAWAFGLGIASGVTTNPVLLGKVPGKDRAGKISAVCDAVPLVIQHGVHAQPVCYPISVQLEGSTPREMLKDAERLRARADNRLVLKVPFSEFGLEVTKDLSRSSGNVSVNVTSCMSFAQGFVAAQAGARYVSIIAGRMEDASASSSEAIRQLVSRLRHDGLSTRVIAASLRESSAVTRALCAGAHIATVPCLVMKKMLLNHSTDAMNREFQEASGRPDVAG